MTSEKRGPGAPIGNKNSQIGADRKSGFLHIRLAPGHKSDILRHIGKYGGKNAKLAPWVLDAIAEKMTRTMWQPIETAPQEGYQRITRYTVQYDGDTFSLDEDSAGEWIKYDDHAAIVAQLSARIAELEREIGKLNRVIELKDGQVSDLLSDGVNHFNTER